MTPAIFKRDEDQPSDEARSERDRTVPREGGAGRGGESSSRRRSGGGSSASVIGPGTTVVGSITMEDDLQIDGRLDGSVSTDGSVTVTDRGTVDGDIEAGEVVVSGQVDGTIRVDRVARFRSGCRVTADVHTPAITVEEGGVVDGRLSMTEAGRGAGSKRSAAAAASSGGASASSGSGSSPSGGSGSSSPSGGSGSSSGSGGSGSSSGTGGSGSSSGSGAASASVAGKAGSDGKTEEKTGSGGKKAS